MTIEQLIAISQALPNGQVEDLIALQSELAGVSGPIDSVVQLADSIGAATTEDLGNAVRAMRAGK